MSNLFYFYEPNANPPGHLMGAKRLYLVSAELSHLNFFFDSLNIDEYH